MKLVDRNRLLGNFGENHVANLLASAGCFVRPVASGTDVGVDLYCETTTWAPGHPEGTMTPFLHFMVQVRSGKQVRVENDEARCAFDLKDLEYWYRQPLPVALVHGGWFSCLGRPFVADLLQLAARMKHPTRRQYKHAKSAYQVRNWAEYEAGLRRRGDITVWLSDDAIRAWRAKPGGRPGGQRLYSALAIETAMTVRMVFSLPLRQAEGFLRSLCGQLELDIRIPDHSTLSRRAKKLGRIPLGAVPRSGPIHLVIDSTGLRVHSGNRRKPPDQRPWRKLHIAVDERSGEISSAEITASGNHDSKLVPTLLKYSERGLASVIADGAYDSEGVYDVIAEHARQRGRAMPRVLIPPRKGALRIRKPSMAMRQRNRNPGRIRA